MRHEEIVTALEEISDKHIREAEKAPKKKKKTNVEDSLLSAIEESEAE